jgi:hypothetical protein
VRSRIDIGSSLVNINRGALARRRPGGAPAGGPSGGGGGPDTAAGAKPGAELDHAANRENFLADSARTHALFGEVRAGPPHLAPLVVPT